MTYVNLGPSDPMSSPDGNWFVSSNAGLRVHDRRTGDYDDYQFSGVQVIYFAWSPDSSTLLFTGTTAWSEPERPVGSVAAVVVDVASGTVQYRYPDLPPPCSTCRVALQWLPSGNEIVFAPSEPEGLRTFNIDLYSHRTLPVTGSPLETGAWSPDGKHVIVQSNAAEPGQGAALVIALADGQVVQRLDDRHLAQAQWIDNERYLAWEVLPGTPDAWMQAVVSLWSLDGTLHQRWIPPIEVVRLRPPDVTRVYPPGPLVAQLG
jgi:hypothetical protein